MKNMYWIVEILKLWDKNKNIDEKKYKIYVKYYHKKSLQKAQNVGCRKNLATSL